MKIYSRVIALIIILVLLVGCASNVELCVDAVGTMEVRVFGIGRSDAILITTENHTVMIDTGEIQHGQYIAHYLFEQGITTIDYLVITHFDSDHVGGAYVIINEIDVISVIVPNYSRESNHVDRFESALEDADIEPLILTETMRFTFDSAEFIIDSSALEYFHFAREQDTYQDDAAADEATQPTGDDYSIIVSVTHGDNSFLFTGDAVAGRLQELLENDEIMNINYDFLKVPRHGRHNRQSVDFIQAISPQYAVITGFHPDSLSQYYPERPTDERIIDALGHIGTEIFFTMSIGVLAVSDGVELTLQYIDFFDVVRSVE
ncbi:MAG: MBL fold metallo-hydrolase [Oscillospiraceae bacterium]|nr:MBL fold metallo-hydrolase [Oscillospiraceae bacterium]